MKKRIDRREFIKSTAGGAIAAGIALQHQSASARILGANDRIIIGFVGTGRQGEGNLKGFLKHNDVQVAALCDVYSTNLDKAAALVPAAERYTDFRRLLDRKELDAVVVSTPDHWHALQTIIGCQAGKDVYVEKPISLTIEEGKRMVQAARKYDRIVQVGTQQRSGHHFKKVVELVRSGRIGKVSFVRTWNYGNQHPAGIGNPPDGNPPSGLDWDMWLGPAPKVPFNANRFGVFPDRWSSFRWFWDYAGGMVTDWSVHLLDIVQWAMGADYPQSVSATGGKLLLGDNRETPDTIAVTFEYPGFICTYENRECNGAQINGKSYGITFHGTEGTIFVDRAGFELMPEKRREAPNRLVDRTEPMKGESTNNQSDAHIRNFLDSVKSRQKPICDIEIGHRTTTTALLANIAYRSRRRIIWDGKREEIIGDRDAAKQMSKPYRKPWVLKV
jgi:predicted dehydrogenase